MLHKHQRGAGACFAGVDLPRDVSRRRTRPGRVWRRRKTSCDNGFMNAEIMSSSLARQFVSRLSSRLENEKRELVLFLIELADFDAKKLALELGYPSTLGCLITELRLSESSACRRISAARLLARFPQIAGYLLGSRLTLMSLVALKEVLDDSNVDELLERASGLSEPEVRQLVSRLGAAPIFAQLAPATPAAATVAADR